MEFLEAKAIAERLGFQLFADVRGDTNALRLFTDAFRQKYGKKYRCGVYMQFRADGSCYIGQSLDVDRRHKRHRELGVIVDYLAFRCWPPSVLMEKEDLCIQDALALGVPLVNKTLKCGTLKKSDDYDQIFTPDEQDLFIERIAARQTPLTQWPNFCKNAERSELRDWEIFSQHPRFMELYQKAAFYLKTTVPNPEETESVTWQCALCNEKSLQGSFEAYVEAHRDDVEALRLIYNQETGKLTRAAIDDLERKLSLSIPGFRVGRLWNDYALLNPQQIKPLQSDQQAVTNLIQLVRYAYKQIESLYTLTSLAAQRFALWCGQAQRSITPEQRELFKKIAVYIAQNGSCDIRGLIQTMPEVAGSLIRFCQSADAANKELFTLNEFILKAA